LGLTEVHPNGSELSANIRYVFFLKKRKRLLMGMSTEIQGKAYVTYWWASWVVRRKTNIKEEQSIMIWSSSWPNYSSPKQINPLLINSSI
jgi:hypothetical protein